MTTHPMMDSRGPGADRPERPRTGQLRTGIVAVLLGLVAVPLAGCGSAPSESSAAPVDACSLLSKSEAAALIRIPTATASPSYSTMQSGCYYANRTGGGVLLTSVSWGKQQLADFRKAHGLSTGSSTTTSPAASATTSPASSTTTVPGASVEVDGTTAYWVSPLPATGPDSIPNLSQLSATKNGYVVGLEGTGLDVTQATGALRTMLSRL